MGSLAGAHRMNWFKDQTRADPPGVAQGTRVAPAVVETELGLR